MDLNFINTSHGGLRWSGELADCALPMTFDHYSRCGYGCVYCFATYQKAISSEAFLAGEVRSVNVDHVKKVFTLKSNTQEGRQFAPFIKARKALQWGGLADPFCPVERELGTGLELLRFFKSINYPITFSTKGTWWTKDERYAELFRGQKNWNVKISIITMDENKRKKVERRCPSSRHRFAAMERVARWDCGGATLRLRPFIIGMTDPGHQDLIRTAAKCGATAVSTEFWCAENRCPTLKENIHIIDEVVGYNSMAFYKKYSYSQGYMRLNRNVKRPFVDEMEEACNETGLRFYVSDAHFKERSHNGCCCGLPDTKTWNYHKGQWLEALLIAKEKGTVRWSDISEYLEFLKSIMFRNACRFNTGSEEKRALYNKRSMYDYLRHVWNHPKMGQSPYTMFEGILKPVKVDGDGNVVYEYDRSRA